MVAKTKPVWSTEQTRSIEAAIAVLNKHKQFAWECGWRQVPWQVVRNQIGRQVKQKGHWLEIAMAYLFGYMNLPMRLSFTREDDMAGADLVFRKTGNPEPLRIQLKWNNHSCDDSKYTRKGIVIVHVDDGMKPADVINQLKLWRLLGADWYKRITVKHLLMVRHILNNL